MTKKHHPHNRLERIKARRNHEVDKLDAKAHKEQRESKVWLKLTKESLEQWERNHELEQVANSQAAKADR